MAGGNFDPQVNPPYARDYAPPLLNFSALGQLPEDAFAATQRARTLQLQAPVIDPRTGQPTTDPNQILRAIAERGGLEATASQLPMIQRQDYLNRLRSWFGGQEPSDSPPGVGAPGHSQAGSPAAMGATPQPSVQTQAQTTQPQLSTFGADNSGATTVRSMATEMFGGRDVSAMIPRFAAALGVDPDASLNADQVQRAKSIMGPRVAQVVGGVNQTDGAVYQPTEEAGSSANTANNGINGQPARVAASPTGPNGINAPAGGPGAGAPAPNSTVAGPSGIASPPPERFYSPGAASVLPEGYRGQPLKYLDQQERIATEFDMRAQEAEILGYPAQGFRDKAAAARNRANKARDAIIADNALTPELKAYVADRKPGETLAAYNARAAGEKEAAVAPYQIASSAIREGGRPVTVGPNQVVTTGATINPELQNITRWATERLGVPGGNENPAGNPPGAQPSVPAPVNGATPPQGQSAFTPRLVRNPDGSVASSVTPSTEAIQKVVAKDYETKHEAYNAAQTVKEQLASMEAAARDLNASNWSAMGTGGDARLKLAKAANTVWSVLGAKGESLPFDPEKIASWAMQVVQGAIRANPNMENSELGFRMVLNAIRENAQRDSDSYAFATKFAQTHGGDLVGADIEFNKINPPELYARRAIAQAVRNVPQEAIEALRANPKLAPAFDKKYGGDGLAKMFLGNAQ
jgi:hypothetical protein